MATRDVARALTAVPQLRLRGYWLLGAAVVWFASCLALSLYQVAEQQEVEIQEEGMSLWLATQADYELTRLRHAVDARHLGDPRVDDDALLRRFDIFWSRLPLLVEGTDSATIRAASDAETLIPTVIRALRRLEPDVRALQPGDDGRHARLSHELGSFGPAFRRMVVDIEDFIGAARQQHRAADARLRNEQVGHLLSLLASGSVLIALLIVETRRTRRLLVAANQARARIEHLAHHDPLTGLPNRWLFGDRLGQALRRADRSGEVVALHCLDLDHFKRVNDGHGHLVGDQLLVTVARRLEACLRESDTVARIGGDEFAIVQTGLAGPEGAWRLAQRVLEALGEPIAIDGRPRLHAPASIGTGLYPRDADGAAALHRVADAALYLAKSAGRGTIQSAYPPEAVERRRVGAG